MTHPLFPRSPPRCGNKAAIVDIDESMNHRIVQFEHAPPKGAGVTEVKRQVRQCHTWDVINSPDA